MSPAINIPSSSSKNRRNSISNSSYSKSPHHNFTGPSSYSSYSSSCSCNSCDQSPTSHLPPLNTPWSSSPKSSVPVHHPHPHHHHHRHQKTMPVVNMNPTPHSRNVPVTEHTPPPPVVIHRQLRAPSQPPTSRSYRHTQSNALVTPAVTPSSSTSRRHRSLSTSGRQIEPPPMTSVYTRPSDPAQKIPGRTRFPRKLVSKSAAKKLHYAYTIDSDHGGLTVLQALSQIEIQELVQLTKEIRLRRKQNDSHDDDQREQDHRRSRSRHQSHSRAKSTSSASTSTRKAVSFYNKTIVHDVPPAPSPPPSSEYGGGGGGANRASEPVLLVPSSSGKLRTSEYRHERSTYHLEPLSPPGPSTPRAIKDTVSTEFPLRGRSRGSGVTRNHRGEVVIIRD